MKLWVMIAIAVGSAGAVATPAAVQASERACTLETLSPTKQREYRAYYERRMREAGKAAADKWLRQRVCPAEARQNRKPASSCKKTKVKNVLKPSFGGGMTLTPTLVCAD